MLRYKFAALGAFENPKCRRINNIRRKTGWNRAGHLLSEKVLNL